MTLQNIRDMILTADPAAQHYVSTANTMSYTVWYETSRSSFSCDDKHCGEWLFEIDRYTQTEFDPVCDAIENALDDAGVTWHHSVRYEFDTQQIHHNFSCCGR